MSLFRRIRGEFEAAEREREAAKSEAAKSEAAKSEADRAPFLGATPAAPAAESARGSRSTIRNAGSPTTPPPGNKGHRPVSKTDRKSTGAELISQNPSQIRSRDGEILIAVMGAAGSSKSYFCRTATGADDDGIGVGGRPGSRTLEPTRHELMLLTDDGERLVTLLNIPGFYDSSHNGTTIPSEKAAAMRVTYAQGRKFSGVLYFYRTSDVRVEGSAVIDTHLKVFQELCGDGSGTLRNVILATNRWGLVESEVGIQRQGDLEGGPSYWEPIRLRGSQVRHFMGTRESALELIRLVMHNTPRPPKTQQEAVDENKPLAETGPWRFVEAEIAKLRTKHEQTLALMKIESTLQKKDEDIQMLLRKESEHSKEIDKLRKQQEVAKADSERVSTLLSEERERRTEESERSKEEFDELRKQQEIMKVDIEKVLTLLGEERDRLKRESERSKEEVDKLRKQQEAVKADNEKALTLLSEERERLKEESERSKEEIDELRKQQEIMKTDIEKVLTQLSEERERLKGGSHTTLGVCDKNGSEIVTPKDLQAISEQHHYFLSLVPIALCFVGQCFAIAWSGSAGKIMQWKDPKLYQSLTMNILECSNLAHAWFREAEVEMGQVSLSIRSITESGVIEEILGRLEEKNPSISTLSELFANLEGYANECVRDSKLVAERTKKWQQLVSKISEAYSIRNIVLMPRERGGLSRVEGTKNPSEVRTLPLDFGIPDCTDKSSQEKVFLTGQQRAWAHHAIKQRHQQRFENTVRRLQDIASKNQVTNLRDCIEKLYVFYNSALGTLSAFTEVLRRYILPSMDRLNSAKTQKSGMEEAIQGIIRSSKEAQEEINNFVGKRLRELESQGEP